MSDSVWPHRRQPTRLPHPWDSPGKNTGVGCHFLLQCMEVKSESEVAQSCLTLRDPMDCSLPGSVHGIFQARVLEWGAIAFSRGAQLLGSKRKGWTYFFPSGIVEKQRNWSLNDKTFPQLQRGRTRENPHLSTSNSYWFRSQEGLKRSSLGSPVQDVGELRAHMPRDEKENKTPKPKTEAILGQNNKIQ